MAAGARADGRPLRQALPGLDGRGSDLATWRGWTGLPFDTCGDLVVPFACNPVHVSVEQDCAVYAAPNVWVHHDLRQR